VRTPIVLIALLVALAAPTAALAQGAGDEQYQDPFGEQTPTPTATATPAPTQAPAQPSQSSQAPAPTATPAPATSPPSSTPSGRQLPYTGGDAGLLALAGAALLGAGIALRRAVDQR
jgi:LPXTG-motif cell wall-anchored protein